ncbi:MAG TPA: PmoA family protein [Candidatus Hydrogenedentes bacterium]|nr:PmoA family protein [Candidatus Hydrogenedentota bacterium]
MPASRTVTVHAGSHDRAACPVSVLLPKGYNNAAVTLFDSGLKRAIPAQVFQLDDTNTLTWIEGRLKAHATRKYKLVSKATSFPVKVRLVDHTKSKLDVRVGNTLLTSYHYSHKWVRPFLHPLSGPGGVRVTRNWPVDRSVAGERRDHVHHKSVWVAHGECDDMDNWSELPGHGFQRHQEFTHVVSGPVFGECQARIDWCDAKGRKRFEELRTLRAYAVPGGSRLLDVVVSLRMTERTVTFKDTKEGGLLSVRVATSMEVNRGGRIENSYGGVNEEETWGKNAAWCDYSGLVDGKHVGIAVFDNEANPRYPTGWHVRNYGLMTANCFAWKYYRPGAGLVGDMKLPKGSTTTWRYRLYVHRGDARKGKVAARYLDYVAPPQVTVQ